jgi:predicted TIM-barrel fold metal-dependent hydrolase
MDRAGYTAAAIHSVATTPKQVAGINRFILESAAAHPGRFVPFATLHPELPDFDAAVDEIVSSGFRGIKLHPEFQNFKVDEDRAVAMFRACAGRLPVLLHCGDYRCDNSVPERICAMLEKAGFSQVRCSDRLLEDSNPSTTWFITAMK